MDSGNCKMHWEGYTEHFKIMMENMLVSKENSDVTLLCDDLQTIRAHKNILSASSPAFQKMFGLHQGNEMFLYMRGIKHQILSSIMEFIYLGEVSLHQDCVEDFITIARSLEVTGLHESRTGNNEETEVDEINTNVSCKTELEESCDDTFVGDVILNENDKNDRKEIPKDIKKEPLAKRISKSKKLPKSQTNNNFECKSCGKSFTESSSLSRHKRSFHDGLRHPCGHCDYQATFKRNLVRHVEVKHSSS